MGEKPLAIHCSIDQLTASLGVSLNVASSVGQTLPLEWTLRKRLEEHLSRNWPFGSSHTAQGKGTFDPERAAAGKGGDGAVAGEQSWATMGSCPKDTVDDIVESTGASAEFAKHALRGSNVRYSVLPVLRGSNCCRLYQIAVLHFRSHVSAWAHLFSPSLLHATSTDVFVFSGAMPKVHFISPAPFAPALAVRQTAGPEPYPWHKKQSERDISRGGRGESHALGWCDSEGDRMIRRPLSRLLRRLSRHIHSGCVPTLSSAFSRTLARPALASSHRTCGWPKALKQPFSRRGGWANPSVSSTRSNTPLLLLLSL